MSGCWQEGKTYGMRSDASYPYTASYGSCQRDQAGAAISTVDNWGWSTYASAATQLQ